jgi:hypothetical protein
MLAIPPVLNPHAEIILMHVENTPKIYRNWRRDR